MAKTEHSPHPHAETIPANVKDGILFIAADMERATEMELVMPGVRAFFKGQAVPMLYCYRLVIVDAAVDKKGPWFRDQVLRRIVPGSRILTLEPRA